MKGFVVIFIILNINNISAQVVSSFIKKVENESCGISTGGPIVQQLSRPLSYTGGIFWSDSGEKIAYIDKFGPALGRYTPNDGRFNRMQINEGKKAIVIFPIKNATGLKFVVGLDDRLIIANITGENNQFTLNLYDLITVGDGYEEFQRGRCDNFGRLWYSSIYPGLIPTGHLYKIENLNVSKVAINDFYCPSGMAWTKDYKNYYLVDSCSELIYKFDFDANTGSINNSRIVFNLEDFPDVEGVPYDIAVDTEGYLWITFKRGGMVMQYDERNSTILWEIPVPASDVISIEFGELDKKTLFVGTAEKSRQKGSGSMYSISGVGATGFIDQEIVIPEEYL